MVFDPKPHLIQLPRKVKDRQTGHYTTVYDDYLEVKWRLVWFRERSPHGTIETAEVCVDLERGYARFRCVVSDGQGGTASGYGTETAAGFADYVERAETRALGRALAALGIGTQFVGQDLTEGDHVADAPVRPPYGPQALADVPPAEADVPDFAPPTGEPTHGQGDEPAASDPTVIPAGLPCAGQRVVDLRPAQLRMLLARVDQLAADEGSRWRPLLEALAAERQARLAKGRKPVLVPGEGNDHG
jgi:hypothetical protein